MQFRQSAAAHPCRIMKRLEQLTDKFGRHINYMRLSVTDRCDLRCFYCVANKPIQRHKRHELLSLEELERLANAFIQLGITKIRITGGEPLIRRGVIGLIENLGGSSQLNELTLTTNGTQLSKYAQQLRDAGVDRLNVSLDTLSRKRFKSRTGGNLDQVLQGLERAQQCNYKRIKINALINASDNDDEVVQLTDFATENGFDITFIEEMPLTGSLHDPSEDLRFVSSQDIRSLLPISYRLIPTQISTGGPARYYQLADSNTASLIGFISARTEHFCHNCNRVRLTATGKMVPCLGHAHEVDLRHTIRNHPNDQSALFEIIRSGVYRKPWGHNFNQPGYVAETQLRPMSTTGG
ncbi:GTP 3',8-cyclase MoaA [Halorhodospira halochloris]|uniref:GTP 3',8-cyclase MoaA n=1 Tax=Halorhodospira halochloris TaxID=1052 RepID=UPI003B75CBD6